MATILVTVSHEKEHADWLDGYFRGNGYQKVAEISEQTLYLFPPGQWVKTQVDDNTQATEIRENLAKDLEPKSRSFNVAVVAEGKLALHSKDRK